VLLVVYRRFARDFTGGGVGGSGLSEVSRGARVRRFAGLGLNLGTCFFIELTDVLFVIALLRFPTLLGNRDWCSCEAALNCKVPIE
jgi:hypothetical protein